MWKRDSFEAMPLALETSAESFRLMQLARCDGRYRIEAAVRRFIPTEGAKVPRELSRTLRQAIDSAPFSTRDVIAVLPSDRVQIRTVRTEPAAAKDVEQAVRASCTEAFPFPLADATLQCINAGLVRQGDQERLEIIAIAALNQDVDDFLSLMDSAKLRPTSLRLACFAGLHCARRHNPAVTSAPRVLVEIQDESTTVMIWQGTDVRFLRTLTLGTRHFNLAVATKLGLSIAEAAHLRRRLGERHADSADTRTGIASAVFGAVRGLLDQLGRDIAACLRYYVVAFRESRPTSIELLGADAADPRIIESLCASLGTNVETVNPLADIDTTAMSSTDTNAPAGEWNTCVGLALGVATEAAHV